MRLAFTAAAALAVLGASSVARALDVKTAVSSQRVGVGESFDVQLVLMSDGQNVNAIGNVRWLRNTLWRSLAESSGDTLRWPKSISGQFLRASSLPPPPPTPAPSEREGEPERERIREAIERNQGSVDKTWRELGLSSRFALHRLLKKYGIILRRSSS